MWSRASSSPWRARVIQHGACGLCCAGVAVVVVGIIFVLVVVLPSCLVVLGPGDLGTLREVDTQTRRNHDKYQQNSRTHNDCSEGEPEPARLTPLLLSSSITRRLCARSALVISAVPRT